MSMYKLDEVIQYFDEEVDKILKDVCLGISERYEIHFLEIGNDILLLNY